SDSDEVEEEEEDTEFIPVDHGQGNKELEVPKVELPAVSPVKSPVASAASTEEKSAKPPTALCSFRAAFEA
ncbi:unnamed protein product, partial [Dibothriocephalus latus]